MIKGVLLDISGVLIVGEEAIPGAVHAVQKIKTAGLKCLFVTNTTRKTPKMIWESLRKFGFQIDREEIFTASEAALTYLQQKNLRPHLLIHKNLLPEFSHLNTKNPNAVVVGDAEEGFNYKNLNDAFRYLMDGAELIGLGKSRYFKYGDNLYLDSGPFIDALEFATGKKAVITGKPSKTFFTTAVKKLGLKPSECVMIGDDVESDILAALDSGLEAILVKIGKFRPEDERKIKGPTATIQTSIVHAVEKILGV